MLRNTFHSPGRPRRLASTPGLHRARWSCTAGCCVLRAGRHGYTYRFVPDAHIDHKGNRSGFTGYDAQARAHHRLTSNTRMRVLLARILGLFRTQQTDIDLNGTVKLSRRERTGPSMTRCPSSFSRHTSPPPRRRTIVFAVSGGDQLGAGGAPPERGSARDHAPTRSVARV